MNPTKLLCKIACGIGLLTLIAPAESAQPRDFQFRAPLTIKPEASTLYRLEVPPEVYHFSQQFPRDIRIFTESDTSWPHFFWQAENQPQESSLSFERLNQNLARDASGTVQLDLALNGEGHGSSRLRHNRIELKTTGKNFLRRVEIYGGHKATSEERILLGEGYLVHQNDAPAVQNFRIEYKKSSFALLRVRIFPDARNSLERAFTVSQIKVLLSDYVEPPSYITRSATAIDSANEKDFQEGRALHLYDTGYENLPLHRIEFICNTPEFVRSIWVSTRNKEDEPWRRAHCSSIFRTHKQARLHIDLGHPLAARYIKIEEHHQDDSPLNIENITFKSIADYLVIEPTNQEAAFLYTGSDTSARPVFDLRERTDLSILPTLPSATLGSVETNALSRAPFHLNKGLITLVVGLCAGLILYVILNMMKILVASDNK